MVDMLLGGVSIGDISMRNSTTFISSIVTYEEEIVSYDGNIVEMI